jgi:uncharacterized protein (DUF1330 family)
MPAYWVARSKINDRIEYKKYADRDPNIIVIRRQGFGSRGHFQVLKGPHMSEHN